MTTKIVIPPVRTHTPAERIDFAMAWYLAKAEQHAADLDHGPLLSSLHALRRDLEDTRDRLRPPPHHSKQPKT